ncbi:MAG: VOC family protein [Candidatus Electronema sp. V4]|uniref:VOC family protein n=1 Tax=Candidatus Electronema sp. V4 TaxID=3454756 RepID=UPI0040554A02
MKFKGINHLALVTGDMEATIRFWRDLLGLRLISGTGEAGFRHYFFAIDGKASLSFFEWDGAQPVERKLHGRPLAGPITFDHIAFALDSADAIWTLKDRLEAAGFPCSDLIDHGSFHAVYSFDPNGIPIEFCCEAEGQDIQHEPALHDADPPPAALEGPEPQLGKWPEVVNPTPAAERQAKAGDSSGFFDRWMER